MRKTYKNLETFNTHSMGEEAVLSLVTGREKIIATIRQVIENNIQSKTMQHLILTGARGMGKSFLLRYFQIVLAKEVRQDTHIDYILFPEEQRNIKKPSAFIYEILQRMSAGEEKFRNSFDFKEKPGEWENAVEKLNLRIKEKSQKYPNYLLIIAVENFDISLAQAFSGKVNNSRMRKWLSATPHVMLLGATLKHDIDSNSQERLFMAFQKEELTPWREQDFIAYFEKRLAYAQESNNSTWSQERVQDVKSKLKAISKFSGGSPRLAIVLVNLVFDDDIVGVLDILEKTIESLTVYYTSILDALPAKSEFLLDAFIREGENMKQSELAELVGSKQQNIAQAFEELKRRHIIKKKLYQRRKVLPLHSGR